MKAKVICILTMLYGGYFAQFGLFALLIVFLQKLMMLSFSSSANAHVRERIMEQRMYMDLFHHLWFIFMPFLFIISLLFIFSGYKMYRQRAIGKTVARAAAVTIILWFVLYNVISTQLIPYMGFEDITNLSFKVLLVLGLIAGYVFVCGYPTFLLFYPLEKMYPST